MKKVLAFGGSNNSASINHKLIEHVTGRINGHEIKTIKLRDYQIPMYSIDMELDRGFPTDVLVLKNLIEDHEALIISVNEHNGNVSAFFKNILDWLSRVDRNFLTGKRILLMSTSNGARGGSSALDYAKNIFPRFGGKVVQSFSFPSFKENYENDKILDEVLDLGIEDVLTTFA